MQKYYFFLTLANIHSILLADIHFLLYFGHLPMGVDGAMR